MACGAPHIPGSHDEQLSILDSRGFVYFRMGDYAAAISDRDAALKKKAEFAASL
jgi:hypothetical protein